MRNHDEIAALAARRETAGNLASRRTADNDDGGIFGTFTIDAARATSHEVHAEIRRMRARLIGELIGSFMWSLSKAARRAWRRLRRHRHAAVAYDAFHELDDRALRDIGLRRSDLAAAMRDDWRMTA